MVDYMSNTRNEIHFLFYQEWYLKFVVESDVYEHVLVLSRLASCKLLYQRFDVDEEHDAQELNFDAENS